MELLERIGWGIGLAIRLADGLGLRLVTRLVKDLACWMVSSLADLEVPRRS